MPHGLNLNYNNKNILQVGILIIEAIRINYCIFSPVITFCKWHVLSVRWGLQLPFPWQNALTTNPSHKTITSDPSTSTVELYDKVRLLSALGVLHSQLYVSCIEAMLCIIYMRTLIILGLDRLCAGMILRIIGTQNIRNYARIIGKNFRLKKQSSLPMVLPLDLF